MIIIYEKGDLVKDAEDRRMFIPPEWRDVDPDKRGVHEAYAETIYIARQDGRFQMVKARNAPLDPYPVRIRVERPIEDEL